ncbi:MAG: phage terminase large subunit family protein, partial [FCB group bacterium]|nr:phage terminase large subunit family protein [FCB group bacterium]
MVYGRALPETAVYVCPLCGTPWDDWQRQENVRSTVIDAFESGDPWCGWVPTVEHAAAPDVEGFCEMSELYVCLPGTRLADLVRDYLEAEHDASRGDESGRIVFTNSKLGRPYEFRGEEVDEEAIRATALDYAERTVPRGGLLLTAGVDVQHNRLAVIVRAWGRNEESWLVYWGELYASVSCTDKNDPVWTDLDALLFGGFEHEIGRALHLRAVTIDSSDGSTNDAVYTWVRTRAKKHPGVTIMAGKGSSEQQDPEIFTTPRHNVDHNRPDKATKADRHGVKVWIVGTNKAKDLLAAQLALEVKGRGRFHHYKDVRADYYDQVTSETKAPHRSVRNRRVWQLKSGRRNEALDGEVYALHAARAARAHLMRPEQWDA